MKQYNSDSNSGTSNDTDNISDTNLKRNSMKKFNRIVIAHININSLRNKFELLPNQVKGNIDILVVSETKSDDSFPVGQFKIPDYASPLNVNCNQFGVGIMVFVREDIPSNLLSIEELPIEGVYAALNLRKTKMFLCCSYQFLSEEDTKELRV